jgi:hypothetical protein
MSHFSNPLLDFLVRLHGAFENLKSSSIADFTINAPLNYYNWWIKLYEEAPLHVLIETGLVIFILWLCFIRKTVDPARLSKNAQLSKKEVDWLVETWQPEPLVSPATEMQDAIVESIMVRFCS